MAHALALGGMVGNATGLNPDGLSLDLNFATDQSFSKPSALGSSETQITSRRGPSPVFSRGTSAMQVGSTGLIEYGPENLLNFSESFAASGGTNNNWTDTNFSRITGVADPIGGNTAIRFTTTTTNATILSSASIGSSELKTFSFWIRRVSGTGTIQYTINGGSSYTSILTGSTIPTTWTRISYTASGSHQVGFRCGLNNQSFEIWGVQLERSATVRQYIPTTTNQVYGPRFDYDPVSIYSTTGGPVFDGVDYIQNSNYNKTSSTIYSTSSGPFYMIYWNFSGSVWSLYSANGTWNGGNDINNPFTVFTPATGGASGTFLFNRTNVCKGLLIEESRTNQIKYSYNNFTNAYWESTASNVTASDSVVIGPDGIVNGASSITEIAGVSVPRHIHEATTGVFTPAANTAYTMSVWVKQPATDPARYVQLAFWTAGFGSAAYMNYDLQTPAVGTGGAGITASSITSYANGWYRITATATSIATPAASGFQLGFSTTSNAVRTESYTVVSPLKSIYAWGAQVEQGAFATSYIPTTTAAAARSTDTCSITSIGSFYKSLGTIYVKHQFNGASQLNGVCAFNTSNTLQIGLNRLTNNTRASTNGAAPALTINSASLASTLLVKSAFAFATNDAGFANNGVLSGTSSSVALPSVVTFSIGSNGGQIIQSGHISEIKYYGKRLTNSKLQAITA